MADSSTIVRFEDVSLHFDSVCALDNVSFEIKAGETRVAMGAAGSGKTMLLKATVGLVKPDRGKIYLFDEEITGRKESDMYDIRSKVGILFQEGALFDSLSIEENVSYPLLNQHAAHATIMAPDQVLGKVTESLRFVELEHTLDKFPSELSGGMRRRVGIARATVTAPPLVLYDSPTAGLDPITANTIIRLIIKQRDQRNTAAIMVTHRFLDGHLMANFRYNPNSGQIEPVSRNAADGSPASTKFLVMKEGRLVFEGSEDELLSNTDPYVQKFLTGSS